MTRKHVVEAPRNVSGSALVFSFERDRDPHYLLRLAVTVQSESNFYFGLSQGPLSGGIFVATPHRMTLGTSVLVVFSLPTFDVPFLVAGVVEWRRDGAAITSAVKELGADHDPIKSGLGVRFVDVDPETALAIRSFMKHRSPEIFD